MAKYDSEEARRFLEVLNNHADNEIQQLQNDSRISDEEREIRTNAMKETREELAFEFGFDNGDL